MKPCRKNNQRILALNYLSKKGFIIETRQRPKCEYINLSLYLFTQFLMSCSYLSKLAWIKEMFYVDNNECVSQFLGLRR